LAGLAKTGRLDTETQELMKTPRCGMDDRVANFVTQGSDWKRKGPSYPMLTYGINKYPTTKRLSMGDVEEEARKAFRMWEESSALQFQEKSSGQVDIEISFERFDHGDGNAFYGKGGA
jgi:matrix metalloproteinase-14 (membrane-inserted)